MKILRTVVTGLSGRASQGTSALAFTRKRAMANSHAHGSNHRIVQLSDSTQLHLQIGDLTKWSGDAIVNAAQQAVEMHVTIRYDEDHKQTRLQWHCRKGPFFAANERMLGGGGVDGAIHRAAGGELLEACKAVPEVRPGVRCPTGEARLTKGFSLPAKYVIHTVGPVFKGHKESAPALHNAYKSSLLLAKEHGLRSIAFPAISCGVYGYPAKDAAAVAFKACHENASELDDIHFVFFGKDTYDAFQNSAASLEWLGPIKDA